MTWRGPKGKRGRRRVLADGARDVGLRLPPTLLTRVEALVKMRERRDMAGYAQGLDAPRVVGAATLGAAIRDLVYIALSWEVFVQAIVALRLPEGGGAEGLGLEETRAARAAAADALVELLASVPAGAPLAVIAPPETTFEAELQANATRRERAGRIAASERFLCDAAAPGWLEWLTGDDEEDGRAR